MSKSRMAVLVVVALVVLVTGIVAYAVAQPAQPGGGGGFQGGGGGRPDMGMMMAMRGMMGSAAIAVSGDAVFVVRGNMIYKFDAGTLELLAQAEIPMPEMPAGMAVPMAPGGPGRQQ